MRTLTLPGGGDRLLGSKRRIGRTPIADIRSGIQARMKPIAALVLAIALMVPATALATSSSTCQAYSRQTCDVLSTTQHSAATACDESRLASVHGARRRPATHRRRRADRNRAGRPRGSAAASTDRRTTSRRRPRASGGRAWELDHRLTPVLPRSAAEYYRWWFASTLGGHAFPASAIGRRARDT